MKATANRLASVQEYYFSRKLREVAQMIKEGHPVINMGIGSPDMEPHPKVIESLKQALNHPKAHMYQSYQGIPELRAAISSFYKKYYQVDLDYQNEVLPLMGSKEGIMHISMAFLNPGDQVLIPNPGYPTYASVSRLMEAEVVLYDLEAQTSWQPNFKTLEAMDTSKVKIMWLNYPHMPTGADANIETYDRLIAWAKEREIFTSQAAESGKPEDIVVKMVEGRVKKFLAEVSLLDQPFVKDGDIKVGKLVADAGTEVVSFARYEVGEGIEVEATDFAAEVAAQVAGND